MPSSDPRDPLSKGVVDRQKMVTTELSRPKDRQGVWRTRGVDYAAHRFGASTQKMTKCGAFRGSAAPARHTGGRDIARGRPADPMWTSIRATGSSRGSFLSGNALLESAGFANCVSPGCPTSAETSQSGSRPHRAHPRRSVRSFGPPARWRSPRHGLSLSRAERAWRLAEPAWVDRSARRVSA